MNKPSDTWCAWNTEQVEYLITNWLAGKSLREIADYLHVSRSAVMGKVQRLKLPGRPKSVRYLEAKQERKRRAAPVLYHRVNVTGVRLVADPPSVCVTIFQLRHTSCRWPLGEPEAMLYCGSRKVGAYPYCAAHMLIAVAPKNRERVSQALSRLA